MVVVVVVVVVGAVAVVVDSTVPSGTLGTAPLLLCVLEAVGALPVTVIVVGGGWDEDGAPVCMPLASAVPARPVGCATSKPRGAPNEIGARRPLPAPDPTPTPGRPLLPKRGGSVTRLSAVVCGARVVVVVVVVEVVAAAAVVVVGRGAAVVVLDRWLAAADSLATVSVGSDSRSGCGDRLGVATVDGVDGTA